ncbi:MAG: STAS/SEC14 domain-containing protein [Gammaproteobacteria bacterium]|jgi:hypothetical protein
MFRVIRNGPNRLDVELSGKIDSDGMKLALDELISKAEKIENGRMLFRIPEFDLPTLGAIVVELSRLPELFRFIARFDRVAVLAGPGWVKTASEIEGALLPGVKVRGFDLDEVASAEVWLAEPGD